MLHLFKQKYSQPIFFHYSSKHIPKRIYSSPKVFRRIACISPKNGASGKNINLVNRTILFVYLRYFHSYIFIDKKYEILYLMHNITLTCAISYQWIQYLRYMIDRETKLNIRIQHPSNIDVNIEINKKYIILESQNQCANLIKFLSDFVGLKSQNKSSILVLNNQRIISSTMLNNEKCVDCFLLDVSTLRLIFFD